MSTSPRKVSLPADIRCGTPGSERRWLLAVSISSRELLLKVKSGGTEGTCWWGGVGAAPQSDGYCGGDSGIGNGCMEGLRCGGVNICWSAKSFTDCWRY